MARLRTPTAQATQPRLDRTGAAAMQGGGLSGNGEDWSEGAVHRGRLRVRTLVTLRWMVVAGGRGRPPLVPMLGLFLPPPLCFPRGGAGARLHPPARAA